MLDSSAASSADVESELIHGAPASAAPSLDSSGVAPVPQGHLQDPEGVKRVLHL